MKSKIFGISLIALIAIICIGNVAAYDTYSIRANTYDHHCIAWHEWTKWKYTQYDNNGKELGSAGWTVHNHRAVLVNKPSTIEFKSKECELYSVVPIKHDIVNLKLTNYNGGEVYVHIYECGSDGTDYTFKVEYNGKWTSEYQNSKELKTIDLSSL